MYLYLFYWRQWGHNCLIRSHMAHSPTYLSVDTAKYHISSLAQAKPLFNFGISKSVISSWKWLADTHYVAEFETYVLMSKSGGPGTRKLIRVTGLSLLTAWSVVDLKSRQPVSAVFPLICQNSFVTSSQNTAILGHVFPACNITRFCSSRYSVVPVND
jgi:hypothetical protein